MQGVRGIYVDSLKAKTDVRVMLDPPRQKVATANSPSKGPANAPIEMVEFSDFQCPFCLRADPTVQQVLKTYGDKIKFVYRALPAAQSSGGEAGRRSRGVRGRTGTILAVSRPAVRQPEQAE